MGSVLEAADTARRVSLEAFGFVVDMYSGLLAICIGASLIVAFISVLALGSVPKSLRCYAFTFIFLFTFAGATTLVALGPVFFSPAELARSQVTPELH